MRVDRRTWAMAVRGWAVLALAATVLLGGSVVAGAWRAVAAHGVTPSVAAMPSGYEVEDHFPGAALLYLDAEPVAGATGTTELPPLPVSLATAQALVAAETGIVPARPFTLGAGSTLDLARATDCLTSAIYYEAASEPDAGQRAVAQVVLNRARHPAFPATVCGVVFQGSEKRGCQFSFACDGAMARVPSRSGWARASRVAAAALAGYVYAPVGLATHYHTYAVTPSWNRTLVMTDVEGAHFFHRWKGYWGTAAAFTQSYRGGEPVPGPHRSTVSAAIEMAAVAAPVAASVVPTDVLPAWRETSVAVALPPATPGDRLPPASQVLDRWKDSGKALP